MGMIRIFPLALFFVACSETPDLLPPPPTPANVTGHFVGAAKIRAYARPIPIMIGERSVQVRTDIVDNNGVLSGAAYVDEPGVEGTYYSPISGTNDAGNLTIRLSFPLCKDEPDIAFTMRAVVTSDDHIEVLENSADGGCGGLTGKAVLTAFALERRAIGF